MTGATVIAAPRSVALRKESVDRNSDAAVITAQINQSLSARRAWIEISNHPPSCNTKSRRSPQGERG